MKIYIGICTVLLTLALSGCYNDKGNYSYSDINEMTLKITPASEGKIEDVYIFTQSQNDTLSVNLNSEVTQSEVNTNNNITYKWIRKWVDNKQKYCDTTYTKRCTFKFPPKVAMTYNVLLIVKDEVTHLEIYRNLTVKTVVPYIRSWLVLHGNEGDRRIGAIEYMSNGIDMQNKELDIYEQLKGVRRFQNAIGFKYASSFSQNIELDDRLFVFQGDSVTWIYPFNCNQKGTTSAMMPGGWNSHFGQCSSTLDGKFGLISNAGKYYHNGVFGYFYEAEAAPEAMNYHADHVYISSEAVATIWDNVHKKLFYYGQGNWYDWRNNNRQDISDFAARIVSFTAAEMQGTDLSQTDLMWMGRGLTTKSGTGASMLFKNTVTGEYLLVNVGYGGKEKSFSLFNTKGGDEEPSNYVTLDAVPLLNTEFNNRSTFASSEAYNNQLFYSIGSDLYVYNIISGESDFLYSAGKGNTITRMCFRKDNNLGGNDGNSKILGLAILTANGQGEIHEVVLNEAGDVSSSAHYDGFGPIIDFCYTYVSHSKYDL